VDHSVAFLGGPGKAGTTTGRSLALLGGPGKAGTTTGRSLALLGGPGKAGTTTGRSLALQGLGLCHFLHPELAYPGGMTPPRPKLL